MGSAGTRLYVKRRAFVEEQESLVVNLTADEE
jgi:hypothetical protein